MSLRGLCVLVVGDDPDDRHRMVEMLRDAGVGDIVGVDCGRCAIDHVDLGTIDVVISDLHMPHMDGIELLRHLAERRVHIPVVLVDDHDDAMLQSAQALAEGYGLEVRGAMRKPVDPSRLRVILNDVLAPRTDLARGPGVEAGLTKEALTVALREGALGAHFQPQVEMATGKALTVEALLRWDGADVPQVGTAELVALIGANGLLDELTDKILDDALRALRDFGTEASRVSVNISPTSLSDVGVADRWHDAVRRRGVEPRQVTFELTEEAVLVDRTRALDVLTRLRVRGFGLALDDFGSGYSDLSLLADLPLTELKVDRTLVHGMSDDWRRQAMLESIVRLADRFGLRSVAEGVELVEDYAALGAIGCDAAQGWLISRAVPARRLADVGWGRTVSASVAM